MNWINFFGSSRLTFSVQLSQSQQNHLSTFLAHKVQAWFYECACQSQKTIVSHKGIEVSAKKRLTVQYC
jgi:hypothetical protein